MAENEIEKAIAQFWEAFAASISAGIILCLDLGKSNIDFGLWDQYDDKISNLLDYVEGRDPENIPQSEGV